MMLASNMGEDAVGFRISAQTVKGSRSTFMTNFQSNASVTFTIKYHKTILID